MRTQNDTARIAALAARQWGVVARRQLLGAGLSSQAIGRRLRDGRIVPLHRGVYAVGHARLRDEGHWLAAVLAVGPGAVLSHRDAAGLLKRASLPSPRTNALIEGVRVDAHWPAHRLIVELDGWAHHHDRRAFQRDRERDATLTAAGWRILRFTHADVTRRPDRVAWTLRRLGIR